MNCLLNISVCLAIGEESQWEVGSEWIHPRRYL